MISTQKNEPEWLRSFTEIPLRRPCVCAFQPGLTLSNSTNTYLSSNKKRKEADYILYYSIVVFFPV